MLARKYRFRGLGSVRPVLRQGVTVRQGLFSIRLQPSQRSASRAAVIVSRKCNKSAVVRNRIRRRVYAQLRELWAELKTPVDLVVIVHDDKVATIPTPDLTQALKQSLTTALAKTKGSPPAPTQSPRKHDRLGG